ncbi:hypothetical protein TUM4438_43200 [Shewanella sairae]|uniref:Transposase n=1 Tax=Shewanella sairae TaxID=190310 RepID=A0ABQ4PR46_9GAMM|nr:hypothetical protein TUM4438_43200 [Shewanella sairae]
MIDDNAESFKFPLTQWIVRHNKIVKMRLSVRSRRNNKYYRLKAAEQKTN